MTRYIVMACMAATLLQAEIVTEEINYPVGSLDMKGYLAYPAEAVDKPVPGVLVVHEWWGHNEYARNRARMLAEAGYAALAVDMYGGGKTASHPSEAGAFSAEVRDNMPAARARFETALALLRDKAYTDPERMAAIGYCFGGGVVLNMARLGVDLAAAASFHGSLDAPVTAEPGKVRPAILVCHGAADSFISEATVIGFKEEMKEAGVDLVFKSYSGALHSFTNPDADRFAEEFGIPIGYDEEADKASWQDLLDFFAEKLRQP